MVAMKGFSCTSALKCYTSASVTPIPGALVCNDHRLKPMLLLVEKLHVVCGCVCVHACVCTCVLAHARACACVCMCVCVCVCTLLCTKAASRQ